MKQKPQAVIFDLGKVLVDFDYGIAARKLAARCEMVADKVHHYISQSPLLAHYETGQLTRQQFFTQICKATGYAGALEEFGEFFSDIFFPIEPMVELQAKLRTNGLPTYIFSNTNDLAVAHIRRNFPFFSKFDGYILSYEVGAMKPDAKIYEAMEEMAGHRGAELLYLDDRPENVEAGRARGWRVILQESPEKTLAEIERIGLLD
ncbi:MAG TPA: HAD family phosphatase [Candidatus Dormibacteraeota bacterium]|nr:HAD family phosphatase [Candidatus Dormibacteraeota bacterium]